MTENTRKALERMHEANAALTPEERKARSAKAAAASKAAAQTRKAQSTAISQAGVVGATPDKPTATTKARVTPEQVHTWDVCLSKSGGGHMWVKAQAPGLKRAMRAAAKANAGTRAVGGILAGILPLA